MVIKKRVKKPCSIGQTPENTGCKMLIKNRYALRSNEHKSVKLSVD